LPKKKIRIEEGRGRADFSGLGTPTKTAAVKKRDGAEGRKIIKEKA